MYDLQQAVLSGMAFVIGPFTNNNVMKAYLLFSVLIYCTLPVAKAQGTDNAGRQLVDRNNGNLLYLSRYESIKGTQFYNDEWLNGSLIAANGAAYKNLQIKFDAYSNKVVINRNDSAFEVVPPPKEIRLFPAGNSSDTLVFKNGYSISQKIRPGTYLQVLAEGKITLLKFIRKDIEEYTEYGDATKFKRFTDMYRYYVYTGGDGFGEIKISQKGLEDILHAQWPAVQSYLIQQKLNQKDEKSWMMAVKYYNTL